MTDVCGGAGFIIRVVATDCCRRYRFHGLMLVGEVLMTITQMTVIKKELRASQVSRSS